MNGMERAKTYAAIFINVGDKWRHYVPLDATVKDDSVYLQGVHMEDCGVNGWRLTQNDESWIIRAKAAP